MPILKYVFRRISALLGRNNLYLTHSLAYLGRSTQIPLNRSDFVRFGALELAASEIQSRAVQGSVAEVGVYRGDFAREINTLFPERTLYLFDTFEGFHGNDVRVELQDGYSTGTQDFSGTSEALVLSKMPHRAKCVVRKGFFPDTAKGIDDVFAFVSLDADLFSPIYEGLKFFYPKLSRGGYIFVHDFNNSEYKGAREAVIKYCQECSLSFVPIPDLGGTAILSK